jgi:hypothetical protein
MPAIRCSATKAPHFNSVAGQQAIQQSPPAQNGEGKMVRYSDDNFGVRALNWVVIAGAAALFALVTIASVIPTQV